MGSLRRRPFWYQPSVLDLWSWTKNSTEASSPPGKTCAPHTLLAISSFSQRKPLHPAASSSLDPPGFPGHTEMRIQPTCYFEVFNSWERAQKSSLTCFLRPMGRITKMGLEEAAQSLHSACTSPYLHSTIVTRLRQFS
jgi:hypothetical protein